VVLRNPWGRDGGVPADALPNDGYVYAQWGLIASSSFNHVTTAWV
jgi:hypothetical protein